MKFGSIPVADSVGAIVAHGVHVGGVTLKKGDVVRAEVLPLLQAVGVRDIVVARLEPDDLGENEAARLIAEAVADDNVSVDRAFTGRANVFASRAGVLCIDTTIVDELNAIDESVTLATLPPYRTVVQGEMVATVKIIPFAVSRSVVDRAIAVARNPVVAVAPFQPLRVGVLSTLLPGLKPSVIAKTLSHLADRLAPAGARIVADRRVDHDQSELAWHLRDVSQSCDLLVVFGASAITDRRDVIPAAIEAAGGRVDHFGMPVDPGNLLLLGVLDGIPVIGAPGCARSPKENGFDWVLQRLLAKIPVTAGDIRKLGAGGLLMEIVSRPQPRVGEPPVTGSRQEADGGRRVERVP